MAQSVGIDVYYMFIGVGINESSINANNRALFGIERK